ncbi:MAG: competence/damage-inducible protein A [Candidatus Eiseniibacteriota bacterium]|nr:MAG: competence/damage-inducible protein A [Candidatus Eisenbacteria bacterium]
MALKSEVITVGSEIMSGRTLDTNFRFIARKLSSIGAQVVWHTSVGDEQESMADVLRIALRRADVVVMTGGLGPTPDDVTRNVVSTVLGRNLLLNDSVLESIRERYRLRGVHMPSINERQALFPKGAEIIENKVGAAPGFLLKSDEKLLFVLPGVPLEAEVMLEQQVLPKLRGLTSTLGPEQVVLRTVGIAESVIAERVSFLDKPLEGAALSYLPHDYGVDVCLTFKSGEPKHVDLRKKAAVKQVKSILGHHLYGEGDAKLEEVVGKLLVSKKLKLAVAESVTGGMISELITSVPGASRYFVLGVTAYSDESKREILGVPEQLIGEKGAVSKEVAVEMAKGVMKRGLADVGISTTGIAGPGGGSAEKPVGLVFVALAARRKTSAKELQIPGNRALIARRASAFALDLLRRHLL